MTPDKRKKIMALLANPASTDNEKEICRKLLKVKSVKIPPKVEWSDEQQKQFADLFYTTPRRQPTDLGQVFGGIFNFPTNMNEVAAQQRQAAADAQQNALRHEWEQRQRDASRQAAYNRHTAQGPSPFITPKANYTQEEFLKAQANIDRQREQTNRSVKNLLAKAFKLVRGKHDTNEGD